MMTTGQRVLLIVSFLLLSVILHTSWLEWEFNGSADPSRQVIAWTARPNAAHGLFFERGVRRSEGILYGVVLPLLGLTAAAYLVLGWRADTVVDAGCCPRCGYDLRGLGRAVCPECGWPGIARRRPATSTSDSEDS